MTGTSKLLLITASSASAILCVGCAPMEQSDSENTIEPISSIQALVEPLPAPAAQIPNGLQERIDAAIGQVEQRDVQVSNGFWTVSHAILGVGPELTLYDPDAKQRVNAVDYICNGANVRGMKFIPTEYGLDVQNGPMFVGQGHPDQFVAEMVQSGMTPDRKFIVHGKQYTFVDFIRQTQSRVRVTSDQELSWAIVAIGQCFGTDITWTNQFDETLHFEDLVRYELEQNIEEAACGGTHRLLGLSWVHNLHVGRGGQMVGVWKEVAAKTAKYKIRAHELQNPDGSFSTDFFRGPGNSSDMQLRINSTGHTLEWLSIALTSAQLKEPWMQRAANALALMILDIQHSPMEGGTLYHAVHALNLYSKASSS